MFHWCVTGTIGSKTCVILEKSPGDFFFEKMSSVLWLNKINQRNQIDFKIVLQFRKYEILINLIEILIKTFHKTRIFTKNIEIINEMKHLICEKNFLKISTLIVNYLFNRK